MGAVATPCTGYGSVVVNLIVGSVQHSRVPLVRMCCGVDAMAEETNLGKVKERNGEQRAAKRRFRLHKKCGLEKTRWLALREGTRFACALFGIEVFGDGSMKESM